MTDPQEFGPPTEPGQETEGLAIRQLADRVARLMQEQTVKQPENVYDELWSRLSAMNAMRTLGSGTTRRKSWVKKIAELSAQRFEADKRTATLIALSLQDEPTEEAKRAAEVMAALQSNAFEEAEAEAEHLLLQQADAALAGFDERMAEVNRQLDRTLAKLGA